MNTSVRRVNSERAPVGRSIRHNDVSAVEADQVCVAGRHHFETVLLDTIRAAHLFHELSKCIRSSGVRDKLAIVKARRPATKTPYLQGSERKAGEIKAIARIGLKSSTFAILIHMAYEHFLNGGVRTGPALSDSLKGQSQKAEVPALMKLAAVPNPNFDQSAADTSVDHPQWWRTTRLPMR